ncbi:PREDICTED: uncharacterized protein LOC105566123, partial [Vollenhovia emeryi]|uniref:uncharacterized protein LOC105566123 n=1 Tax=Vollenhovia emeryi TaxID=411798 RepID=UPI0005F4DBC3
MGGDARTPVLVNEGRTPTCVRTQGESIVDITWATPSAMRLITRWRVEEGIETLSDHRYISVEFGALSSVRRQETRSRWALRKLREDALMAACWRRLARCRRRGEQAAERAREGYFEAKVALRKAIRVAKGRAWTEFLDSLQEDPWGRPYKMVLNKLRPWAPPLTERLDGGFVRRVVQALFPDIVGEDGGPPFEPGEDSPDCDDSLDVQPEELRRAVAKGRKGNTAPGSDGLHKRIHALAMNVLAEEYARL